MHLKLIQLVLQKNKRQKNVLEDIQFFIKVKQFKKPFEEVKICKKKSSQNKNPPKLRNTS